MLLWILLLLLLRPDRRRPRRGGRIGPYQCRIVPPGATPTTGLTLGLGAGSWNRPFPQGSGDRAAVAGSAARPGDRSLRSADAWPSVPGPGGTMDPSSIDRSHDRTTGRMIELPSRPAHLATR